MKKVRLDTLMSILHGFGESGKSAVWFCLPIVIMAKQYNFSFPTLVILFWLICILLGTYYYGIRSYEQKLKDKG